MIVTTRPFTDELLLFRIYVLVCLREHIAIRVCTEIIIYVSVVYRWIMRETINSLKSCTIQNPRNVQYCMNVLECIDRLRSVLNTRTIYIYIIATPALLFMYLNNHCNSMTIVVTAFIIQWSPKGLAENTSISQQQSMSARHTNQGKLACSIRMLILAWERPGLWPYVLRSQLIHNKAILRFCS